MLNVLWLSIFGAIIGGLPGWISFAVDSFQYPDYNPKHSVIPRAIIGSILVSVITLIDLYIECEPQIFLTVLCPLWLVLLVYLLIALLFDASNLETLISLVLAALSFLICLSVTLLAPVQTLIYVHDAKNVDAAYTVSSDEILLVLEDNGGVKDNYYISTPEMRKVAEKDLAVYHINNNDYSISNLSEYIPGYAIKEEGQTPQLVSKRLYFDTSYLNEKDALRTVRRVYPTIYIGDHKFDIDDNYNPYEIYAYRENLLTSDGKDYGIITLDLQDGTVTKYPADKVPSWVDFKSTYPR